MSYATLLARPHEAAGALLWRHPDDHFPQGAQLYVGPEDTAVFEAAGRPLGAAGPGQHVLAPQALPFLAGALDPTTGSLLCDLFFVSTAAIPPLAVEGPLGSLRDVSGDDVPLAFSGRVGLKVTDPGKLAAALGARRGDPLHTVRGLVVRGIREIVERLAKRGEIEPRTVARGATAVTQEARKNHLGLDSLGLAVVGVEQLTLRRRAPGEPDTLPAAPPTPAYAAPHGQSPAAGTHGPPGLYGPAGHYGPPPVGAPPPGMGGAYGVPAGPPGPPPPPPHPGFGPPPPPPPPGHPGFGPQQAAAPPAEGGGMSLGGMAAAGAAVAAAAAGAAYFVSRGNEAPAPGGPPGPGFGPPGGMPMPGPAPQGPPPGAGYGAPGGPSPYGPPGGAPMPSELHWSIPGIPHRDGQHQIEARVDIHGAFIGDPVPPQLVQAVIDTAGELLFNLAQSWQGRVLDMPSLAPQLSAVLQQHAEARLAQLGVRGQMVVQRIDLSPHDPGTAELMRRG